MYVRIKDTNQLWLRTLCLFYVIWSIKTIRLQNMFIFSRFFTNKNIAVYEKFKDSEHDCLEDCVIMSWLKMKAELYIHQMLFFIIMWRDWFFSNHQKTFDVTCNRVSILLNIKTILAIILRKRTVFNLS